MDKTQDTNYNTLRFGHVPQEFSIASISIKTTVAYVNLSEINWANSVGLRIWTPGARCIYLI